MGARLALWHASTESKPPCGLACSRCLGGSHGAGRNASGAGTVGLHRLACRGRVDPSRRNQAGTRCGVSLHCARELGHRGMPDCCGTALGDGHNGGRICLHRPLLAPARGLPTLISARENTPKALNSGQIRRFYPPFSTKKCCLSTKAPKSHGTPCQRWECAYTFGHDNFLF